MLQQLISVLLCQDHNSFSFYNRKRFNGFSFISEEQQRPETRFIPVRLSYSLWERPSLNWCIRPCSWCCTAVYDLEVQDVGLKTLNNPFRLFIRCSYRLQQMLVWTRPAPWAEILRRPSLASVSAARLCPPNVQKTASYSGELLPDTHEHIVRERVDFICCQREKLASTVC